MRTINSRNECICIGPSPATGYHTLFFYPNVQELSGARYYWPAFTAPLSTLLSFNRILPLARAQRYDYSIDYSRQSVSYLGKPGLATQVFVNKPVINLQFSYLQNGIYNERLLGFNVNYPRFFTNQTLGYNSGAAFHSNTPSFISGMFFNKDSDSRNIFIAQSLDDFAFSDARQDVVNSNVVAFGNCYLQNYNSTASVGNFPMASVSYICENIKYDTGVTLFNNDIGLLPSIPAITPKSGLMNTGIKYNISKDPTSISGFISVIKPKDILLSIKTSGYSFNHQEDVGVRINDLPVQSYSLNIDINREALNSIGYQYPLDRRINLPIFANVSFDLFMDEMVTGSLLQLINQDKPTNISLILKNSCINTGIAIQYFMYGAKLTSNNIAQAIRSKKTMTLQYQVELNPFETGIGLFVSGVTNLAYEPVSGYY